jgi:hypothetical protein
MSKADEIRAAEYDYQIAKDNFRYFSRIEGRLSRQEEREKYEAERAVEAAARALHKLKAKRNPDPEENKTKGVHLTLVVEWREAKPPEREPKWGRESGEGRYGIRRRFHTVYINEKGFTETMTTANGADKALDFMQRWIKKDAQDKPAWLVYASIRLGTSSNLPGILKLPVLLKTSYWTLKHGNFGAGPGRNWIWGKLNSFTNAGRSGPVYETVKFE